MKRSAVLAGTILISLSAAALAAPREPTGLWLVADGTGLVVINRCGAEFCGVVAPPNSAATLPEKTKGPVLTGATVLSGLKPESNGRWKGTISNPKDGSTYTGIVEVVGTDLLKVSGCVMGGMVCGSQNWTRIYDEMPTGATRPAAKSTARGTSNR